MPTAKLKKGGNLKKNIIRPTLFVNIGLETYEFESFFRSKFDFLICSHSSHKYYIASSWAAIFVPRSRGTNIVAM